MSLVSAPKKAKPKKSVGTKSFTDGITNVFNSLVNGRSASKNNVITESRITFEDMNACYKSGIGNKIVRVKSGQALNDTLSFVVAADEAAYNEKLAKSVKRAAKLMLAFGRSVIMIHSKGDDLSQPLGSFDPSKVMIKVFDGSIVYASTPSIDINSETYKKPQHYTVRGVDVHCSRIIDFTYVEPIEEDLPEYQYGGISEYELIYDQLVNDAIVQRASASILEKSSNMIYKVKGFKDQMRSKRDDEIIQYFTTVESMRGLYGAVIIDDEDSAEVLAQTLTNLSETDDITLRRLSMVTGLSYLTLVGEGQGGLNNNGESEAQVTQDTIETLQSDYLIEPIKRLCSLFGIDGVSFKEGQGGSAGDKAAYEKIVLEVAEKMALIGADWKSYLDEKGVTKPDNFAEFFGGDE